MRVSTHESASAGGPDQGFSVNRVRLSLKSPRGRKHCDQLMRRVLAESVRRHRLGRRWSVETLAARSQLTPVLIGQIEGGSRRDLRLGTVERLARALQVDVVVLLDPWKGSPQRRGGRFRAPEDRSRKRRAP
jgi:hypothetical protein